MAERMSGPSKGDHVEVKLTGRVMSRHGDHVSVMLHRGGHQWVDVLVPVDDVVILTRPGGDGH